MYIVLTHMTTSLSKSKVSSILEFIFPESVWFFRKKNHSWIEYYLYYYRYLINRRLVEHWNRQFGCETIHPTQKFTPMNLLQMPCVIREWSFMTSEVVEAVRGQKHILAHTLAQRLVHPTAPVLLSKDTPRNEISYNSQPPFSLHISNSRTKPVHIMYVMNRNELAS